MLCYVIICYARLCYVILCFVNVILRCVMLCYVASDGRVCSLDLVKVNAGAESTCTELYVMAA